jgi:hypothetical protein
MIGKIEELTCQKAIRKYDGKAPDPVQPVV